MIGFRNDRIKQIAGACVCLCMFDGPALNLMCAPAHNNENNQIEDYTISSTYAQKMPKFTFVFDLAPKISQIQICFNVGYVFEWKFSRTVWIRNLVWSRRFWHLFPLFFIDMLRLITTLDSRCFGFCIPSACTFSLLTEPSSVYDDDFRYIFLCWRFQMLVFSFNSLCFS